MLVFQDVGDRTSVAGRMTEVRLYSSRDIETILREKKLHIYIVKVHHMQNRASHCLTNFARAEG